MKNEPFIIMLICLVVILLVIVIEKLRNIEDAVSEGESDVQFNIGDIHAELVLVGDQNEVVCLNSK